MAGMRLRLAVAFVVLSLTAACAAPRRDFPPADAGRPFNSAVLAGGVLWVAGHLGVDPQTGQVPADPADEARVMLDAFAATLARAGMTMDDLVSVQVFCSDVSLYDTFNAIYRERFTKSLPARAFIGSGPLLRNARFEIQGNAVAR
jgi:enamine deaminase RidA (YjgF/YER057c/UK114 family)